MEKQLLAVYKGLQQMEVELGLALPFLHLAALQMNPLGCQPLCVSLLACHASGKMNLVL